ncbi:MAG: Flp pilus assembly protein CpaB [Myxococcota bacterium]
MNIRTVSFLVLSLGLASAAAYLNWSYLSEARESPVTSSAPTAYIAVALRDISISEVLNPLLVETKPWPADMVPNGAFHSMEPLVGRVPNRHFAVGEPILESGLFAEGANGGLSPLIQSGLRAMSVKVDQVIGIAGFVAVGTRVDVLATIKRGVGSEAFSQVVVQDIRVLAVDQTLDPHENDPSDRISVVTLEVTPNQAQKLAFVSIQGSIQLALRNPRDSDFVETTSVNTRYLKGAKPAKLNDSKTIEVMRGVEVFSKNVSRGESESPEGEQSTGAWRSAGERNAFARNDFPAESGDE